MSIFSKIKQIIFPQSIPKEKIQKTFKDLDVFDTIWILDNDNILLEGWVFDINKKHIIVTIPLENNQFLDFRFSMIKPLSKTFITQNNKTLFLNKPCMSEISSSTQQIKDI